MTYEDVTPPLIAATTKGEGNAADGRFSTASKDGTLFGSPKSLFLVCTEGDCHCQE